MCSILEGCRENLLHVSASSAGQRGCTDAAGNCLPPAKIPAPSEVPKVLVTLWPPVVRTLSHIAHIYHAHGESCTWDYMRSLPKV